MDIITSLRQYRVGDFAIFDFALTFAAAAVFGPFLSWLLRKKGWHVPIINWFFLVVPFGMLAHVLTGRITPLTEQLLDPSGHFLVKGIMLLLVILGLRGIKRVEMK